MGLLTSKRAASLLAAGAGVLALGAMSDSASAACTNITGQGATFQAAAQNAWIGSFTGCPGNVTYRGTGSGAGLAAFGVGGATPTGDAFIGTDDAPTAAQITDITTAANRSVRVFPVVQAAVAVLSHLPDNCTAAAPLEVDNQALQDVYDGSRAVTFNDLFPSQLSGAGCTDNPRPYGRSGTSGTTQIFKQFLSLIASGINTTGDNVWPAAAGVSITATGGGNMADLVNANRGTVGYAVLADALGRGFTADPENDGANGNDGFWVSVDNGTSGSNFQAPEITVSGQRRSNCASTPYTGIPAGTRDADWSGVFGVTVSGAGNYPICGLSYVVAYEGDYATIRNAGTRGFSTNTGDTASQYFVHVTGTSGQALVNQNNYAALTGTVLTRAVSGAAGVAR